MNTSKFKITVSVASAVLLFALQQLPAHAEQEQIFNTPPSAEEMGKILFGKSPDAESTDLDTKTAHTGLKTRSISFAKKAAPEVANSESIASEAKQEVTKSASSGLASIGLPIKFAYNSDEILPESLPFLDEVGKMLSMDEFADKRIVIEGHTDASGSASYNRQLSQQRASAVSHYLAKNYSISASRMRARGVGESKPLPGYAPDDEANRRVQFYSAN